MSPNSYLYFDYYQTLDKENEPIAIGGYVPIEKVYNYEPMPADLDSIEQKRIFGVQANLWTEYIPHYYNVQYMELPRMAALSEVQWTAPEKKDYTAFTRRVPQLIRQYEANSWHYAPHIFNVNPIVDINDANDAFLVTLTTVDDAPVHYTLDGTEPTEQSPLYESPVTIDHTSVIKAAAFRPNGRSAVWSDSVSFNKATARAIKFLKEPSRQYYAKGARTLNDGQFGGNAFNTGDWVGFNNNPMDVVIDLGKPEKFSSVGFNLLIDTDNWIFDANDVTVQTSANGNDWTTVASEKYPVATGNESLIRNHTLTFPETEAQYVRVIATPLAALPAWHTGKGKPAFIFVDEIVVE